MKYLAVLCLLGVVSCSHERSPASLPEQKVAHDSTALGKVNATAVKKVVNDDVCFDVNVTIKSDKAEYAQKSNWSLAWVDSKDQYHLLNMNQRDPASVPQVERVAAQYGEYQQYVNNFKTCAPGINANDIKSLVLTPKALPFKDAKGLHLNWN